MKVVALGEKAFVTGFVLSGVKGEFVSSPQEALAKIQKLSNDPDVALIMISSELTKPIQDQLTQMRAKRPVPLIYGVPGPGSKQEKVEYRKMLRQILGV